MGEFVGTLVHDAANPAEVMRDVDRRPPHPHAYTKIGVSTRAAAALWATQHAVVR